MNLWSVIVIASAVVAATKFIGFVLPSSVIESEVVQRISDAVTVALLSALVVIQTAGAGTAIVVDARLVAVGVAGFLQWKRAPFIVVILVAALVAAGIRLAGWLA
ncbi:MAG: AzlD domain-containing protein [Microbacteriaceae bacterium]